MKHFIGTTLNYFMADVCMHAHPYVSRAPPTAICSRSWEQILEAGPEKLTAKQLCFMRARKTLGCVCVPQKRNYIWHKVLPLSHIAHTHRSALWCGQTWLVGISVFLVFNIFKSPVCGVEGLPATLIASRSLHVCSLCVLALLMFKL